MLLSMLSRILLICNSIQKEYLQYVELITYNNEYIYIYIYIVKLIINNLNKVIKKKLL
jgi:hypothetical protein